MTPKETAFANTAATIIKNLERRSMEGHYCATKEDALQQILSLLEDGKTVSWGGSQTLEEIGLFDALEQRDFTFYDRFKESTEEEKIEIIQKIATCDYYFMSSNAITIDGELINIDGLGNRTASLIHGPSNIFVVVGKNKIVGDIGGGIARIQAVASPANAVRLERQTPCAVTGVCGDCFSPDCMCAHIVITRKSVSPQRIKVFLVGEELGY